MTIDEIRALATKSVATDATKDISLEIKINNHSDAERKYI